MMTKGLKIPGGSLAIAVIASVVAILIFQGLQSAFFSDVLTNSGIGNYTVKKVSIRIYNISYDKVQLAINDEICPSLKERESCYSGCNKVMVKDIKNGVVDIDVTDEVVCEVNKYGYSFGMWLKDNLMKVWIYINEKISAST